MADASITEQQRPVPPLANGRKRSPKTRPSQFAYRMTIGLDGPAFACLNEAKQIFGWTDNQVGRWALDLFFKSEGLMTRHRLSANNGGTNGRPG